MREGEGFLDRWSRRKREVPAASGTTPADVAATPVVEQPAAADEAPAPSPSIEDHPSDDSPGVETLPSIEDLSPESDLSLFMRAEVPDGLRQQAIKRMWSLDPAIRDFVGLADYAYDYNDPNGVPGFGPMRPGDDIAALLRQALGEPEPAPEIEDEGSVEDREAVAGVDAPPVIGAETEAALEITGSEIDDPGLVLDTAHAAGGVPDLAYHEQNPLLANASVRDDESVREPVFLGPSPVSALEPAPTVPKGPPSSVPAPPRRRHGGAAPR